MFLLRRTEQQERVKLESLNSCHEKQNSNASTIEPGRPLHEDTMAGQNTKHRGAGAVGTPTNIAVYTSQTQAKDGENNAGIIAEHLSRQDSSLLF